MSDINFCNTKEQLNHLGEVVTGKVDGSPTGADIDTSTLPYTGQVRKTLPALEGEYEQSIVDKEAEAEAAIDSYRLLNKGPYASGITLESKFEYITYNGESYFATNPPYTTTATTPDADGNLFLGGYTTFENVANKIGNKNELSNSNFLKPSPDAITHPNETPESYAAGTQIFSGVYAGDSGCTVTLIDGRVNCTAGDYKFKLPNTGGLERIPAFTSSVSDYDGIPKTTGVSHALFSDEHVVTVTPAAGDVFSVKFEQGSVATRHEVGKNSGSSIIKSSALGLIPKNDAEDTTSQFIAAEELCRTLGATFFVEDGTYRVDDTVIWNSNNKIVFSRKAKLKRFSSKSANTSPVFALRGSFSSSEYGLFETENDHPDGVVALGALGPSDIVNALWWRCVRPEVTGVQAAGNIGIHIPSAQNASSGAVVNYFGYLENPVIRQSDEGIVIPEVSNGHTIIAPNFYKCITSALSFYGAYSNSVFGGFVHGSSDGVIGVNLRNRRSGADHHSLANFVSGLGVEPGGAMSQSVYVDTECTLNNINIIGNTAGGLTVLNRNNNIDTAFATSIAEKTYYGMKLKSKEYQIGNSFTYSNQKTGIAENTEVTMFTVTIGNRQGLEIEVAISGNNTGLDLNAPTRYRLFMNKPLSGVVVVDTVQSLETSGFAAKLSLAVSGSTVALKALTNNNGTATTFDVNMTATVIERDYDNPVSVVAVS